VIFIFYARQQVGAAVGLRHRSEFFNFFNHTQFNNPNGNFNNSLFGYVSSARDPRIGQIA
jgi:hypothetical protein